VSTPPSIDFGEDVFDLVGAERAQGLGAHVAKRTELQSPQGDGLIVRRLDLHRTIERAERPEDVTDFDADARANSVAAAARLDESLMLRIPWSVKLMRTMKEAMAVLAFSQTEAQVDQELRKIVC
jgi:hypothetical protein